MGVLLGKVGLEHGVAETSWSFERYIPRAGTTAENCKKNIRPFHVREKITFQDGRLFQGEAGTSTYFTPRKGESSNEGFPKKKKKCGIYSDNSWKGKGSIVTFDG